jgi:hypothetical protein
MEARRLEQDANERPTNVLNHRLIVRMGGKEWVIGEDESPVVQPPNEKLISLSMMSSRMSSQSVQHDHVWAKWSRSFYEWWTQFHRVVVQSLDRLLQHHDGGQTSNRDDLVSSTFGRSQHMKREANLTEERRTRVKDGLTLGCIIGLMLGCIGLILFHLVAPIHLNATAANVKVRTTSSTPPVTQTDRGFVVPAVRIYATQVGSFRTVADAQLAQKQLAAKGVQTALFVEKPIRLVSRAAAESRHLKAEAQRLQKLGIPFVITTFNWPANDVPTFPSVSMDSMHQISHWLSAEVSALNALVGVLSDGVPKRDAMVARDYAAKFVPGDEALRTTGHGATLIAVKSDFNDAFKAYEAGNPQEAMLKALDAYSQMQSLVENPDAAANPSSSS